MQIKIYRIFVGIMLLGLLPLTSLAQKSSSLNAFSPYTFYGIGEVLPVGTSATRSMGGIGVAYWNPFEVNLLNPAAYSSAVRKSAVLTVGVGGRSSFLKTNDSKTAHNAFNVNDFALMLPLSGKMGFALSVTPYSAVGYNTEIEEHNQPGYDPNLGIDVGHILYSYTGDGNISQIKAGVGWEIFNNFSVGANFIAYLGTISRNQNVKITSVGAETFRTVSVSEKEEVGDVSFDVGFQYRVLGTPKRALMIGATYQPDVSLRNKLSEQAIAYDATNTGVVTDTSRRISKTLPQKIAGGLYYHTNKFGVGLDYSYQDWTKAYKMPVEDRITLKAAHNVNFGMHYTPNRADIRRYLNRWTYRLGFRYSDLNMVKDGEKMHEMALTFGFGIPLRSSSPSEMSIGVELGRRGKTGVTKNGFPMIQDNFFRVSVGFTLFDNGWFIKYKYD